MRMIRYRFLFILLFCLIPFWSNEVFAEDMDGWSFTDTTGKDEAASGEATPDETAPDETAPDDAPVERKRHPLRDVEWASIAVGSGSFLISLRGSAPTLVWNHFYWTTLSMDIFLYQARHTFYGAGLMMGQSYGHPWLLDPEGQHELRLGAYLGLFFSNNFPIDSSQDYVTRAYSSTTSWFGFAIGPELTYLYRLRKHLNLTLGIRSAFAAGGTGDNYPFPYLAGQVGLAF